MDGNGRWATQRGLPRLEGHRVGTENIRRIVRTFAERSIPYLTLYAFSTENWSRPPEEVGGLFRLLGEAVSREVQGLHREGVRLRHIGRLERLPEELQRQIRHAISLTQENRGLTLCLAFDYGGRDEIVDAVQALLKKGVAPEEVTAEALRQHLYAPDIPDPDLIVRTAGEMRLSNFLLWQAAYAEYYSTPVLWPDFGPQEVEKALAAYTARQRRFGALGAEG
ncbi:MAG: di-trans,poly-cis-decaprenylcistransferase [Chloroflexi bacterium]|nr:di-trans,poly-cis-decaprenylcistransferase [Chloroflexota bacterium]